ncbi:SDR family NAD(P)-dependent oxidoreductase [Roseococcus suduntuyensis]|uniref:NAD(P)-dependent dehydrogenase (Short-subunit alcohol dehydrogenase family) n=1 Tax=Roseococcus suduntuyensis TaxID=455361 RepID=A0A840AGV2_9PROT|nr:SDR family NAD(P)-dependent oxidoreductase [Roseococcus suduntuyensis]MBB3899776.1 NAD(P)-dependent dehydrogenase (short-subunit alcohol dehydrogenase family) [Roseococcus suduntuyensis]
MEISGASAIVSGGGSGLGAATAEALAQAGAKVVVLDIDASKAEAVATRIGGVAIAGDVADEVAVAAAVETASLLAPLRVVVACAGIAPAARIAGRGGPHDLALFERVIRVNLVGTFNLMRVAASRMTTNEPLADGERGLIICTASVAAYEGQVGQAAYAASKGGIVALTLPAARELARFGVRVVTIAPGLIHTPLMDTLTPEAREALSRQPLFPQRLGRPEEFGALVLTIAANPLLNGETIRLDGALRLPPA